MSLTGFVGEIRIFAFTQSPPGWLPCDGQLLEIGKFSDLYAVIGTRYGGDGTTSFALPDMRGRVPIGPGNEIPLGGAGGTEQHTLTAEEMPAHTHVLVGSTLPATSPDPTGRMLAGASAILGDVYGAMAQPHPMAAISVGASGAGEPHENMQPFLALAFMICVDGNIPAAGWGG